MGKAHSSENRALENVLRQKNLFPNTSAPWQQETIGSLLHKAEFGDNPVCLDAACGIGNNIATLSERFKKIIAFDRSPDAIRFAKERYSEYSSEEVSFSIDTLESISQPDDAFDCVVCTEALEHIQDYDVVIRELFRITKSGGYVILSFQNHLNLSVLLKVLFEKLYQKNWDVWGTHSHEEGYESYLTCFQIKESIRRVGFVSMKEFGADYINAWLSWIPFFYRNYKILDRYPLLFLGKVPLLKYTAMDYFMLLKKS